MVSLKPLLVFPFCMLLGRCHLTSYYIDKMGVKRKSLHIKAAHTHLDFFPFSLQAERKKI